ncbi:phenylacetate-CoA ligase [Neorhodopirellula lusitana]|uniref:Phenylacetate-CoA ligase n=1 Tax=Neorhodopirellula lusitana TaxID=445327 RepID=A0ABY1PRU0_9BACT|nr:AMP-binding protein [Neorhodopirellula lusitana]SMP44175.1 phenylacetate-CoA ligase [Neorhodopirellula lusitana]
MSSDVRCQAATYSPSLVERFYRGIVLPGFDSVVKGRKTFQFADELNQSQWWPVEKIEELQSRRLSSLIEFCWQHSCHYRDAWTQAGLKASDIDSAGDLSKLPLTTRETMRDHASRIRTWLHGQASVVKSTGGSSGSPLRFTIDTEANDRRVAAALRGYAMAGGGPGTKQVHLWGGAIGDQGPLRAAKEYVYSRWLNRRVMLDSFGLCDSNAERFVRQINRHRPDVLVAYTNPIDTLSRIVLERDLSVHQPRAIITGAEKLHVHQRQRIEEAFGAPVFETYGSREFTLIGAECSEHAGLHLTSENLIVEVVDEDGRPTPEGEEGDIAVTDLWNRSTPFVRYLIGDRAVAGLERCPCGRGLPLLRKVVGRQLDMLPTLDGRRLPGEFFPHLIKDFVSIRQFQVVQRTIDEVVLKVIVDQRWSSEQADRLHALVSEGVGRTTRLRIEEVAAIPVTKQGKHRVVVSHVVERSIPQVSRAEVA